MPPFRTARERKAAAIPTRHRPQMTIPAVEQTKPSWLPTDASGAALALTINDARAVQVGRLVFASFSITWPATANGSVAKIGGLPRLPRPSSNKLYGGDFAETTAALTRFYIDSDGNMRLTDSTGLADATNAGMSTKKISGTLIYETSA